ncbi:MAG: LytTR family DNA-binding domain-containing protein [Eubacteriales bacterium]|nr:LytTR family DNA-binding domain-containing protein [Lachnospiraceae bacterium]MDO5126223.1 LytTR family DNA-binding domain-containing protein [Eubacteriales bacterium]
MKIVINIDENISETEIQVSCKQLTEEVENMIATLRIMNEQMLVQKEQDTYLLDVSRISYIESLERKSFVYTEDDVYESKLKLYEMEEKLCRLGFLRISKSTLVNLKFIKSIRNDVERRLRLTLSNGEQVLVSRQYADEIKKRLGVR